MSIGSEGKFTPQDTKYEQITPEIKGSMQAIVESNFRGELAYALTSGSIVFGGAIKRQSDMDLMVVLKREFTAKPKTERDAQIKGLVDGYLQLHKDHDFMPDTTFPGEYITEDQAEDAIAGRGYHASDYNELFLPQASEEYYLEDPERWYRAWLSMTAYGEFVTGDRDRFEKNKKRAWNAMILFNSDDLSTPINPNGVIDKLAAPANKWAGSGISERYFTFREHELPYVEASLIDLVDNGYFTYKDGLFVPNGKLIKQWHTQTATRIQDKSIRKADFLINLEDSKEITQYAEHKWEGMVKK